MPAVKISASVLNADLSELGRCAVNIAESGIEYVHFDVMDGEFVDNITFGSAVQDCVKKKSGAPIDTHLMVLHPEKQIRLFAQAGSDIITFHVESECEPQALIDMIHGYGIRAGIALKPDTPAKAVFPYLKSADMVLVMTVEPGYGGQGFIAAMTDKIRAVRQEAARLGLDPDIEVDGGINAETAALVKEAGANVLVAGTYLLHAQDMRKAAELLRQV